MKKIFFATVCFVVSINIFISTFNLTKDQVGSITLSSLSEANAAEIEEVTITCNTNGGRCYALTYGWCPALQDYATYCSYTGYQNDSCSGSSC